MQSLEDIIMEAILGGPYEDINDCPFGGCCDCPAQDTCPAAENW